MQSFWKRRDRMEETSSRSALYRDQQGQVTRNDRCTGQGRKVQYPDGRKYPIPMEKQGKALHTRTVRRSSFTAMMSNSVFPELKRGDSVITYGYDPVGRLCEKQFPNGTKTTYRYDRKGPADRTVASTREASPAATPICMTFWEIRPESPKKERKRALERESGRTVMEYDALGELSEIQRTERSRHGMVMMPLETVHGKRRKRGTNLLSV